MGSSALRCFLGLALTRTEMEKALAAVDEQEGPDAMLMLLVAVRNDDPRFVTNDMVKSKVARDALFRVV